MRLDKRVRECSHYSRREITRLFEDGRITSSTERVSRLHDLVFPDEVVFVDGEALTPIPKQYVLLNKPLNIITTRRDPFGRPDLREWCADGLHPVGRLDKETTGLLILTNDGDLNHSLLNPASGVEKTYILGLRRPKQWLEKYMDLDGIDIDGLWVDFIKLDWADRSQCPPDMPGPSYVALTISEGRNRIVRRIAKRLRWRLKALHRTSVGDVAVAPTPIGQLRTLSDTEIDTLWHASGGLQLVLENRLNDLEHRAESASYCDEEREKLAKWLQSHPI